MNLSFFKEPLKYTPSFKRNALKGEIEVDAVIPTGSSSPSATPFR